MAEANSCRPLCPTKCNNFVLNPGLGNEPRRAAGCGPARPAKWTKELPNQSLSWNKLASGVGFCFETMGRGHKRCLVVRRFQRTRGKELPSYCGGWGVWFFTPQKPKRPITRFALDVGFRFLNGTQSGVYRLPDFNWRRSHFSKYHVQIRNSKFCVNL